MAKTGSIQITQKSQSITNNTSIITVTGIITTSGDSWRGDQRGGTYSVYQGGTLICTSSFTHGAPQNSTTTLFSFDWTVTHNSDGSSGIITAEYNYDSGWCTGSGSLALSKIPRKATISSASDFNDEENPVLKYSNPAGSVVSSLRACISLTGSAPDVPYRSIPVGGSSYTFSLTDDERNTLRNATISGSNSRKVYFYIETVIGGNYYYDKAERTFTVINALPTLEADVTDSNQNTVALTGDSSVFVRYKSNASVSMIAEAKKGASIVSKKITCAGKSVDDYSGTITGVESGKFVFSVTDNRGNTVTKTLDRTLVEYVKLTCLLNANAPDGDGNMNFSINGSCFSGSFGSSENEVQAWYRYKVADGAYGEWTEANTVASDNAYSANVSLSGLDYTKQHTFQARVSDSLDSIESKESTVKTIPIFDWGENDFNFNVPVTFQGDAVFNSKISGKALLDLIHPVGSIYMSASSTNPGNLFGGTWVQWGNGRVPVGVNSADGDFSTVEKTGGSKTNTHHHFQTVSFDGSSVYVTSSGVSPDSRTKSTTRAVANPYSTGSSVTREDATYDETISILQPYITCYMWKRTA